jgi:hypothetical protein
MVLRLAGTKSELAYTVHPTGLFISTKVTIQQMAQERAGLILYRGKWIKAPVATSSGFGPRTGAPPAPLPAGPTAENR